MKRFTVSTCLTTLVVALLLSLLPPSDAAAVPVPHAAARAGDVASLRAAADPDAPKAADWRCFTGGCFDFRDWYTMLPYAGPGRSLPFQRETAAKVVIAVYARGMWGRPDVRANLSTLVAADPRCAAKVAYDDAYRFAKSKDGRIEALVQVARVLLRNNGAFRTVSALYTPLYKTVGAVIKKTMALDQSNKGIAKMLATCDL